MTFAWVFLPQYWLLLLSIFLIYDFHATFDRGVKVRLFCSQQCPKRTFWNVESSWVRLFVSIFTISLGLKVLQSAYKITPPKRRFWNAEQKMRCGFSIDFSMARGPNCVLTPLKSASKICISSFVHPSNIFVWGAYKCVLRLSIFLSTFSYPFST
jgi:hypothetical protein